MITKFGSVIVYKPRIDLQRSERDWEVSPLTKAISKKDKIIIENHVLAYLLWIPQFQLWLDGKLDMDTWHPAGLDFGCTDMRKSFFFFLSLYSSGGLLEMTKSFPAGWPDWTKCFQFDDIPKEMPSSYPGSGLVFTMSLWVFSTIHLARKRRTKNNFLQLANEWRCMCKYYGPMAGYAHGKD